MCLAFLPTLFGEDRKLEKEGKETEEFALKKKKKIPIYTKFVSIDFKIKCPLLQGRE